MNPACTYRGRPQHRHFLSLKWYSSNFGNVLKDSFFYFRFHNSLIQQNKMTEKVLAFAEHYAANYSANPTKSLLKRLYVKVILWRYPMEHGNTNCARVLKFGFLPVFYKKSTFYIHVSTWSAVDYLILSIYWSGNSWFMIDDHEPKAKNTKFYLNYWA